MAQRLGRLKKECQQLRQSPPTGVSCWPEGDDLSNFTAVIIGDEDTVFKGGIFKLEVEVPDRYPFQPPKVRFLTKIYHPNIDSAGRICLDVLKLPPTGSWRPMHNLSSVLTSVRLLMATPNPSDPVMTDIAEEYQFKKSQYDSTAREWTMKYAKADDDLPKIAGDENIESSSSLATGSKHPTDSSDDEAPSNKKIKS